MAGDNFYSDEDDDLDEDEEFEENVTPAVGGGSKDVQINVEISDIKNNEIYPLPTLREAHDVPVLHLAQDEANHAEGDVESSDLGFSDENNQPDEHAYQIEQLGTFEVDQSSEDLIEPIDQDR